ELVGVLVHLEADGLTGRDGHQRDLEVLAGPGDGPVVAVGDRLALDVEHVGAGPLVADGHGGSSWMVARAGRCPSNVPCHLLASHAVVFGPLLRCSGWTDESPRSRP